MVKNVQIALDTDEHQTLFELKGDLSWKQLLYKGIENLQLSKK